MPGWSGSSQKILASTMPSLTVYLLLSFLVLGPLTGVRAEEQPQSLPQKEQNLTLQEGAVRGALQGLKEVVALWSEQRFSDLYDWGTEESQQQVSKEQFIQFMSNSSRRLLCCWATLQQLQGIFKSTNQVYVRAKLGYENFLNTRSEVTGPDTESTQWVISSSFVPQTFLMVFQQNRWRIDLAEILLASGYLSGAPPFKGKRNP